MQSTLDMRIKALIALQAAHAMEYLHSRNIIHFDVKAENFLCDLRDLSRPVVKVADVGLSKHKIASFVTGSMRGTLPWMAPELFPAMPSRTSPNQPSEPPRASDKVKDPHIYPMPSSYDRLDVVGRRSMCILLQLSFGRYGRSGRSRIRTCLLPMCCTVCWKDP